MFLLLFILLLLTALTQSGCRMRTKICRAISYRIGQMFSPAPCPVLQWFNGLNFPRGSVPLWRWLIATLFAIAVEQQTLRKRLARVRKRSSAVSIDPQVSFRLQTVFAG